MLITLVCTGISHLSHCSNTTIFQVFFYKESANTVTLPYSRFSGLPSTSTSTCLTLPVPCFDLSHFCCLISSQQTITSSGNVGYITFLFVVQKSILLAYPCYIQHLNQFSPIGYICTHVYRDPCPAVPLTVLLLMLVSMVSLRMLALQPDVILLEALIENYNTST
jgi:hypothetical protein